MKINLPVFLTLYRIFFLPVIIICYYLPVTWAHPLAAVLAFFVGISDFFDGYLARRYNQITKLGAFLDPVADKLAVAVGLILLVGEYTSWLLTICAMIIIAREIVISALREWMAEKGKRSVIAVAYIGKVKTCVQGVALLLLLWFNPHSPAWMFSVGLVSLILATLLTIWSMCGYLKSAWRDLCLE